MRILFPVRRVQLLQKPLLTRLLRVRLAEREAAPSAVTFDNETIPQEH